ncbi:TPA: tRNA (adenosine(37)-N6)-threonylcarbamoyltransferase complex transferase subunit TsaD [Patescibacteria group bacterium]|nr:tRNA (adenosine(37)-N6)-threonylcarbamoyltransferase complex transferase subunit TsaD [Patescibacteria group bacterium]|tara:strand:+ start:5187 stop:6173 length:987 start_codon:yes stop_codon:yes gene_type:complete
MKTLAIETSCDETALALVDAKDQGEDSEFKILAEAVASQIKIHRPFGGVVPHLAKREHEKNLPIMLEEIKSQVNDFTPDQIAVTVGPGLEPALWPGINFAQELAEKMNLPLIGVNHLEGHVFSNWLENSKQIKFPAIVLVISGGHTILLLMEGINKWKKLGETRDDAVGEAFDKVARMLDLPYPGGPEIEKMAHEGNPKAIKFPRPMIHDKNYDFSFSGLKTSVLYHLRDNKKDVADVSASFQEAAFDVLAKKTLKAVEEFNAKSILLCGGVAANKTLQNRFAKIAEEEGLNFSVPQLKYNTDNGVMIAVAAHLGKNFPIKADSSLNL